MLDLGFLGPRRINDITVSRYSQLQATVTVPKPGTVQPREAETALVMRTYSSNKSSKSETKVHIPPRSSRPKHSSPGVFARRSAVVQKQCRGLHDWF